MNLKDGFYIKIQRITVAGFSAYNIAGLFLGTKRIRKISVCTYSEDAETLDFMVGHLKKIKNASDEHVIINGLTKMAEEYNAKRHVDVTV